MYKLYETHGFKIYLDANESGMMKSRTVEKYEVQKFKWLKNNLTQQDTFIDVGANKGDFTLLSSLYCSKVYSVEPHPNNIKWLEKSIAENQFKNIDVLEGCATEFTGTVNLYEGAKSGYHSTKQKNRNSFIEVSAFRLDDIVKEESLVVKIDVEGSEINVLEGLQNIMHNIRAFLIDVDSGDHKGVLSFLKDYTIKYRSGKEIIAIQNGSNE